MEDVLSFLEGDDGMRLDKFLSHTGFGSRKEVKQLLKKSEVVVNGVRVKEGKQLIEEIFDEVLVNGILVNYQVFYYYLLHKPMGVISATKDPSHRTVLDLLSKEDYREDLFPIGRLDKETTGLLMITNDGAFSHSLLSPNKHVSKRYFAEVQGIVTTEDCQVFAEGVVISGGEICLPAKLEIVSVNSDNQTSKIRVTITEGKYHQVKRMFEAVGKKVTKLHRETMGGLVLDPALAPGEYRQLEEEELSLLGIKAVEDTYR